MATEPPGILMKWFTKQHLLMISSVWPHVNYQPTWSFTRITIGYIRKFFRHDRAVLAPFNRPMHMSHIIIWHFQHGFGLSESRSTQLGLRQCLPKFGISKFTSQLRLLSHLSLRDEFLSMVGSLRNWNGLGESTSDEWPKSNSVFFTMIASRIGVKAWSDSESEESSRSERYPAEVVGDLRDLGVDGSWLVSLDSSGVA
jgi:hypothetical protein